MGFYKEGFAQLLAEHWIKHDEDLDLKGLSARIKCSVRTMRRALNGCPGHEFWLARIAVVLNTTIFDLKKTLQGPKKRRSQQPRVKLSRKLRRKGKR